MLCVTTNSIDGKVVRSYRGLVAAEVVFGANFFRDVAASITDVVGGRSMPYEKEFEGGSQRGHVLGFNIFPQSIGRELAYEPAMGPQQGQSLSPLKETVAQIRPLARCSSQNSPGVAMRKP